jgi:hypothetical protein
VGGQGGLMFAAGGSCRWWGVARDGDEVLYVQHRTAPATAVLGRSDADGLPWEELLGKAAGVELEETGDGGVLLGPSDLEHPDHSVAICARPLTSPKLDPVAGPNDGGGAHKGQDIVQDHVGHLLGRSLGAVALG